jgi:glycosyltransferase involved in cell wall biosynthesis
MNVYNSLVKHYNDSLQYVLYLSPNLKKIYVPTTMRENTVKEVISFGIKDIKVTAKPIKNTIGYIGNLRPGQGLEFILEAAKKNPKLIVEFAGDGPLREELEKIVKTYKLSKRVTFHGFVTNEELLHIVKRWEVAVAPYLPSKDNPTMYTEPGKIKLYIEFGLPVIMTKVSYIYKDLIKYNAGTAIDFTYTSFAKGLLEIQKNYKQYKTGVENFKKDNQFEGYYHRKFRFLESNEKKT